MKNDCFINREKIPRSAARFFFILSVLFLQGCSPSEQGKQPVSPLSDLRPTLAQIKRVPLSYTTEFSMEVATHEKTGDSVYESVVKMDTVAIEPLINILSDTAATHIANACENNFYTFGQLAFLLLNDIEMFPYMAVTNTQYDSFGCGDVPEGFLADLKRNGGKFQEQYRRYFHSENRKQDLQRYGRRKRR